jgi:hypothetical protein
VNSPLDDALGDLGRRDNFSRQWQQHEASQRYGARKKVVDAIEDFLRRMTPLDNRGTSRLKVGFLRSESVWRVGWIFSESKSGFLLTPDGRISSSGYGMHNQWTPYRSARFFDLDGREARALEEEPVPSDAAIQFADLDLRFMPEADAIIKSLAALVKGNSR